MSDSSLHFCMGMHNRQWIYISILPTLSIPRSFHLKDYGKNSGNNGISWGIMIVFPFLPTIVQLFPLIYLKETALDWIIHILKSFGSLFYYLTFPYFSIILDSGSMFVYPLENRRSYWNPWSIIYLIPAKHCDVCFIVLHMFARGQPSGYGFYHLPSGNLLLSYWTLLLIVDIPIQNGGSFHS